MNPGRLLRALGPWIGLLFTWALFRLLVGAEFGTWSNQKLMLLQTAVVGTAAIGATWIIVSGGIDLSVGSTIALTTMVIAHLLERGAPPTLAALGGLAAAAVVGLSIGVLVTGHVLPFAISLLGGIVTGRLAGPWVGIGVAAALGLALSTPRARRSFPRLELSPFIVTLGMWGALRGLAKGIGDNQPIYPSELGWLSRSMQEADSGPFALLVPGVWVLLGVALVFALLLENTVFGRHVVAIGSSEETARLCGVRVERTKVGLYALAILCAGIAGVLQLGYLSMGDPTTAMGYELKVIAAVVIGGASLTGGEGSIQGTLVGALIMVVVDNGCTQLGLDNWVQDVVTGGIILTAVALDRLRHTGRS